MPSIVYTSLVRSPQDYTDINQAIDGMLSALPSDILEALQTGATKSDWEQIDGCHFNITRMFPDLISYQNWIHSDTRNRADKYLMDAGWYLYTKQGHIDDTPRS